MLENKLATLQRVMAETQEASESSWQALIDEDRLLSRLEVSTPGFFMREVFHLIASALVLLSDVYVTVNAANNNPQTPTSYDIYVFP